MKMQVLAIYDSAVEAYLQPIFTNSKGKVIREFLDLATEPDHPFSKHVEHYCLFEIGFWDDNKGELIPVMPVKVIGLWEAKESEDKQVQPSLV